MKKKDPFKKYLLIYSGELMLFVVIFLVLGILKLLNVMKPNATRTLVFNWITIFGGAWIIIDLIWMIFSKKRRKKNCLLDKILNLPIGIALIILDIICFIKYPGDNVYNLFTGSIFVYIAIDYCFQSIYHYFKPLPSIVTAYQEELKEKEKEKKNENEEEKK